jgi:predicted RNase H-like HicB family nuclease
MRTKLEYPVLIEPLSPEDGGGFLATVPDLPGCMSDGETPEEALANVRDAVEAWIEEARTLGRAVPPRHAATWLRRRAQ